MDFAGNMVALVTPFRNDEVDVQAFENLVDRCIEGGGEALVPCGTTGESPTLSHDEHDRVIAIAIERSAGRVPIVAGTGSNSTAEAVRLTRAAASSGASAALVVTPYYNKPSANGLLGHFLAIADCSDLPIVLYDIPGRTAVGLDFETLVRLAEHPNIMAIKEATGDVGRVTRIRAETSLAVLSGDDALTLPMLALGAHGVISVLANLLPDPVSEMVAAARAGNFDLARQIHDRLEPLMRAMFLDTNPIPVKTALAERGLMSAEMRLPLTPMSTGDREQLVAVLDRYASELPATVG